MQRNLKNQEGISVLLSVLLVASLTVMTLAMSDIVMRVARGSRQTGESEVAYYAAESAAERGIYSVESTRSLTMSPDNGELEEIDGVTWAAGFNTVASSSPIFVSLLDDESFQLEFNFSGLNPAAPTVDIACSGAATVITLSGTTQTSYSCPVSDVDLTDSVLRVTNDEAGINVVTITSEGGGDIPVGILITGTGNYKNEQRVIESERKNWQIY